MKHIPPKGSAGRRYVVAMVLGTALTGLAASSAAADTNRAVNDISRYCTACWRNARLHPDSWTDCTQEVFCRLLQRVAPDWWSRLLRDEGDDRREFLRAIDSVKKRSKRARHGSGLSPDLLVHRNDIHERRLSEERDAVRHAAGELLTGRQCDILQLSFDGWSVNEIAAEMRLPASRVSDEKYKAVRKLRERLAGGAELVA